MKSSKSKTPVNTSAGTVVLIEEYDALGMAISSALKKFAPGYAVHVFSSPLEAQKEIGALEPTLFIVDFDPPHERIVPFINKLKTQRPDARAIVIASGVDRQLTAELGLGAALHFVAKPFELQELGAAIQALLGPWTSIPPQTRRGTLRHVQLADFLQLKCLAGATAILSCERDDERVGTVHVQNGQIVDAALENEVGREALVALLQWRDATVTERPAGGRIERTIEGRWQKVLLEAVRDANIAAGPEPPPAAEEVPLVSKDAKRILIVDDTEMMRIFVEDILTQSDLDLQLRTVSDGLEAVGAAMEDPPDLILLDFSLPDFCGDEVCRRLLADKKTAGVPVVMMSGHVAEMAKAEATFDNIVGTIAKPFRSEEFLTLVGTTLREGRKPFPKAKAPSPAAPPKKPARAGRMIPAAVEKAPAPVTKARILPEQPTSPAPTTAVPKAPPVVTPPPATLEIAPTIPPLPVLSPPPAPVVTAAAETTAVESKPVVPPTSFPQPEAPPRHIPPAPTIAHVPPAPPRAFESPSISIPPPIPQAQTSWFSGLSQQTSVRLVLQLEVVAIQLTPDLRLDHVRARPALPTVSLSLSNGVMSATETGFELGPARLQSNDRIDVLRVVPTANPVPHLVTRTSIEIAQISLSPKNSHEELRLTPSQHAPMRMHFIADFMVEAVELTAAFQISALVLKAVEGPIQLLLGPAQGAAGQFFRYNAIKLDERSCISELALAPASR